MQVTSQIPQNIVYLGIGGKVYKFDLVSKECHFEFSSFARTSLLLYDFDDKLVAAQQDQVRLWDFFDHKEEVPELVTVLEAPLKIECIKVNKFAEQTGERKGEFYYVISARDEFKIYIGRMELLLEGTIDDNRDIIKSIEFGIDLKLLYIGTEKGKLFTFELPSRQEVEQNDHRRYPRGKNNEPPRAIPVGEPRKAHDKSDYEYSVTLLYRITGILDENFFAMHVKHAGLKIWNHDTNQLNRVEVPEYSGEIDNIKATPDGRFLVVGFANAGIIRFFRVWKEEAKLTSLDDGNISVSIIIAFRLLTFTL